MTIIEAEQHVGDTVVYDDGYGGREDGTIVRVNHQYVFVRYGGTSVKATAPERLNLLSEMLS